MSNSFINAVILLLKLLVIFLINTIWYTSVFTNIFFYYNMDWKINGTRSSRHYHHHYISLLLSTAEHGPPQVISSVTGLMPPASNNSPQQAYCRVNHKYKCLDKRVYVGHSSHVNNALSLPISCDDHLYGSP